MAMSRVVVLQWQLLAETIYNLRVGMWWCRIVVCHLQVHLKQPPAAPLLAASFFSTPF